MCAVKLLVWALSNFFIKLLSAMNFPLKTAFTAHHKFGYCHSLRPAETRTTWTPSRVHAAASLLGAFSLTALSPTAFSSALLLAASLYYSYPLGN